MAEEERPQEDIDLEQAKDEKPPRFMVVLADFQTQIQVQVGAPEMKDFLKPLPQGKKLELHEQVRHVFKRLNARKINTEEAYQEMMGVMDMRERFELERVIRHFNRKVKQAEKNPWPKQTKEDDGADLPG